MEELRCGKCGAACSAADIYVCSECGTFVCPQCERKARSVCPDCFGRLGKLC